MAPTKDKTQNLRPLTFSDYIKYIVQISFVREGDSINYQHFLYTINEL